MTTTAPQILPDDTARTRRSDPVTSHEAADSNDVHGSQVSVLLILSMSGPLADHELVERIKDYSPSRVRTARHEMQEAGLIEYAGFDRLTAGKRRTQVWQVTGPIWTDQ